MTGLELLGWSWPEIGAAFALAASAIVVLYLVRLRRRVVTVPYIALFREALPDERTTRLFTRLKNLLSLLLVLLVAALIALALGRPQLAGDGAAPRTVVIVVDTSASMQARVDDAHVRFDRAREAALALIAALHDDDTVIVVSAASRASVVHPATHEHALARSTVEALFPTDSPGDAREALAWARSLCRTATATSAPEADASSGVAACEIHVLTDGGLAGLAEETRALRADGAAVTIELVVDEAADNVAITALSARRFPADPSRAELLVELTSFASAPVEATLSILADGNLAHRESITLAPGASLRRTLDELTGADALFEARITREDGAPLDALGVDDVAWARLAPRRRRRALLVGPSDDPNVYLEAALLLDPYLDVVTRSPEAYESAGIPADRELLIFDRHTPSAPPRLPALLLSPTATARPGVPGQAWLPVGEPVARPHFDAQDREHPLVAFVALRDVNIASACPLLPLPGDEVVAGEARGALLTTGTREGVRFVALGLDVRDSDLPLRIAWPLLVLDAVAYLVPDDVTLAPSAETGRPFRLALPEGRARLVRADASDAPAQLTALELTAREGIAELALDRAGLYTVQPPDDADAGHDATRTVVANLFSRDESSLASPSIEDAVRVDPEESARAVAARDRQDEAAPRWPLHVLLVAAALALLAFEWLTFHRRWTT